MTWQEQMTDEVRDADPVRARLDAERITISAAAEGDEDAVLYAAHDLAPRLLAAARDVLALTEYPNYDPEYGVDPHDIYDAFRRHLGDDSDG